MIDQPRRRLARPTDTLRIGVDATCWINRRGYGRFTRELLRALVPLAPQHTFVCLLDRQSAAEFDLAAANVETVVVAQSAPPARAAAANGYRTPVDMLRLMRATHRARLDVFFSPSVYTFFPLPPGLRALITVHDVIADRHPDLTLPSRRARLFWRMKCALAVRQARLILTVSPYAARSIAATLGVPAGRIRVALEAPTAAYRPGASPSEVASAAARAGLPPGASWFTYVGGFGPHKHVDLIVRAHADVARRTTGPPPHLLLIGTTTGEVFHDDQARIRRSISACGTEPLVRWTGFLPDDEIRLLHTGALALLLPSREEGFGLPAIEAAACGTPVIATTASPLPELLDGGGIFVTPGDEAALADALDRVAHDAALRDQLARTARLRASHLTWSGTADAVLAALREAAA